MWTFLNPVFLWAAAAAVIPLLLHLLRKRQPVKLAFSTIRFLQIAQKRSAARVRLENLLLWLLRTLILLLLALAFALPVLRTGALGPWLGTARRDVAIVWDVSYSLDYESGRRRVWDDAQQAILGIIDGLSPGDRVCIFLADEDVTALIAQPTGDLELVRALVRAQEPQPVGSRLQPAVAAAVRALESGGGRERELSVITDGQALPWAEWTPAEPLPANVTTFVALLGPTAPRNDAVANVAVQPALLMTTTPLKIAAQLAQSGGGAETTVSLFINDQEIARRTARGAAEFTLPPLPRGTHAARIEIPPDGLSLDNTFHFLLRVRDQLPVLVIGSETDAFFLLRALNPTGQAAWNVTRQDAAAPLPARLSDQPAVFLVNALPLPGQSVLDLENYVRSGGVLAIFPGDRARAEDYASWNGLPARVTGVEDIPAARVNLRLDAPADPLFAGVRLPPGATPAVSVRRRLTLEPVADAELLLSAGDMPFLLGRTFGDGRVLLATVAADRRWSDLPLAPLFLPLAHQIVQYGAGTANQRTFHWAAAETPVVTTASQLTAPDGGAFAVRATADGLQIIENARWPGLYRAAGEPVVALNAPRQESDLTPVDPATLPLAEAYLARDPEELLRRIEQHRVGRPLGETLFWVVLALAVIELVVANRAGRKPATVSEQLRVAPGGRVLPGPHPAATS